jgi:hypothetical protein
MKLITDFGVRALLGTIVSLGAVGTLGYLALHGNAEAQTTLSVLVSGVIAFYFGQKSKGGLE